MADQLTTEQTPTVLQFISEITVKFIDKMGSDARIVEAMMVSSEGLDAEDAKPESVEGRIRYLMKHRHGTPFECGALTIRGHCPIKVWREWHRHRIASYNEESGRYKQLDPVFYIPPRERKMIRPEGFKSARPVFDHATEEEYQRTINSLMRGYSASYKEYKAMLADQVDRGLARDVLGVGIYSSCYVTVNPRSIMAFLELRTHDPEAKRPSHPLYEIEVAARKLESIFARLWPITYKAFCDFGRMAP